MMFNPGLKQGEWREEGHTSCASALGLYGKHAPGSGGQPINRQEQNQAAGSVYIQALS